MSRWAILALAPLAPAAMARDSEEGRTLAVALTRADVDTRGACEAGVEGMGQLGSEAGGFDAMKRARRRLELQDVYGDA